MALKYTNLKTKKIEFTEMAGTLRYY